MATLGTCMFAKVSTVEGGLGSGVGGSGMRLKMRSQCLSTVCVCVVGWPGVWQGGWVVGWLGGWSGGLVGVRVCKYTEVLVCGSAGVCAWVGGCTSGMRVDTCVCMYV